MRIEEKATFPRPDFIRTDHLSLNGEWQFDFDDGDIFFNRFRSGAEIEPGLTVKVPFPYQSEASGIASAEKHEKVIYKKIFTVNGIQNKTALLHFGAVDRDARVYLNKKYIGCHTGGYTPFCFDVSSTLFEGENELTVFVCDEFRPDTVRGKQIFTGEPYGCFYTPVTGIWQDVYLELTGTDYITDVHFVTDFDSRAVTAEITFDKKIKGRLCADVTKAGAEVMSLCVSVNGRSAKCLFSFEDHGIKDKEAYLWSPAHPNLFDVLFTLETENGTDTVDTYFGIRKVGTAGNKIYFNNSQFYLRAVLDQGYWESGIYRPADDAEFGTDVELTLALGFNCARKHQKIEDPKYYYYADRFGLLVWGELPSFFGFGDEACRDAENTLREFIERDRNHPSIIAWVPFNESWGLRGLLGDKRQADFARELYYLCRRLDPERLVSTNDGWENVTPTDIFGIHDYRSLDEKLAEYYSDTAFFENGAARTGHPYLVPGENYGGKPVLLTEFGGKRITGGDGWGYDLPLETTEKYLADIKSDVDSLLKIPTFCGYCYTQLTDVYQEVNGLLYMNRTPKADIDRIKEIFKRNR